MRQHHFCVDPAKILVETLPEQDWVSAWEPHFKPIFVSPKIVVKPPWEKVKAVSGQIIIDIDSGRAFGTGNHPSTQLALKFLERNLSWADEVLDIATSHSRGKIGRRESRRFGSRPSGSEEYQKKSYSE